MIRKLNIEVVDRVITAATNGTLVSVSIYKAKTGKNKGTHMVDFKISNQTLPGSPINSETHKQFLRTIKKIRQHVINEDFELFDLTYVLDAHHLRYRIVGKQAG